MAWANPLGYADKVVPARAVKVREMTGMDIPWFIDLGIKRYPSRWDPIGTEWWLRNRILANATHCLAIRTDHAACVTVCSATGWLPSDWDALVTTLMADEGAVWETLPLLRTSRDWAHRKKCVTWKVATETKYDLGALARRVGAVQGPPYYVIDWREERWAKA